MKNYLKAKIEGIDDRFIYLINKENGYYFKYLEVENLSKLDFKLTYKFYIAKIVNEFETIEIIFLDLRLRNLFLDLIKIKTVGFKTTIFLLNNFNYEEIYEMVENFNVEKLASIKGIGIYTSRLIIDSLQKEWFDNKISDKKDKVVISLMKLGFPQKNILKAIHKIDNNLTVEQMTESIIGSLNE